MSAPQRLLLSPTQIDDLGLALLTLSQEVWRLADRQRALETILARHGIDASAEIETYQPHPDEALRLQGEARAFARRIIAALAGDTPQNPGA
jgi:hypothetical protein